MFKNGGVWRDTQLGSLGDLDSLESGVGGATSSLIAQKYNELREKDAKFKAFTDKANISWAEQQHGWIRARQRSKHVAIS